MSDGAPEGPFRRPELTEEAKLERAREQSWARVDRETSRDRARLAVREKKADRAAYATLAVTIAVAGLVVAASLVGDGRAWSPWVCPAVACVLVTGLVIRYRRRLRAKRREL